MPTIDLHPEPNGTFSVHGSKRLSPEATHARFVELLERAERAASDPGFVEYMQSATVIVHFPSSDPRHNQRPHRGLPEDCGREECRFPGFHGKAATSGA